MADVLICGIAVVDYVYKVDALPTRAEKYRASGMDIVGGGCAANAAVAVARLGGHARLLTRLGDDAVGQLIASELSAEGVDMTPSALSAGARSPMSAVFVDPQGERMIMNFRGAGLAETAPVPDVRGAVLADTRWPQAALAVLHAARAKGIPGVLDAEAPVPRDVAEAASHVVFSAQGLLDFTGETALSTALATASQSLPGWVAVTDGPKGVAWIEAGKITWLPGFTVPVVDTLGAGDVWHGAFTLALAEGQSEHAAARFAHAAAALKCTAFGGRKATPSRDQVSDFMKEMI